MNIELMWQNILISVSVWRSVYMFLFCNLRPLMLYVDLWRQSSVKVFAGIVIISIKLLAYLFPSSSPQTPVKQNQANEFKLHITYFAQLYRIIKNSKHFLQCSIYLFYDKQVMLVCMTKVSLVSIFPTFQKNIIALWKCSLCWIEQRESDSLSWNERGSKQHTLTHNQLKCYPKGTQWASLFSKQTKQIHPYPNKSSSLSHDRLVQIRVGSFCSGLAKNSQTHFSYIHTQLHPSSSCTLRNKSSL